MTSTIRLAIATVTLTVIDDFPSPHAAELSRRRFEPASEAKTPAAAPGTKPQVETWGRR
ncbi:MAG: hypothetical protein NVSMB47_00090 [Polyangiales bacterium]